MRAADTRGLRWETVMKSLHAAILGVMCALALPAAFAQQCPPQVPVQGAQPQLPVFPPDNWWNLDITGAPVDPGSVDFIAFIDNGGTRTLHPDFGGEVKPGSEAIYGFPYAIVDGTQ